jgi:hypothetical protein
MFSFPRKGVMAINHFDNLASVLSYEPDDHFAIHEVESHKFIPHVKRFLGSERFQGAVRPEGGVLIPTYQPTVHSNVARKLLQPVRDHVPPLILRPIRR